MEQSNGFTYNGKAIRIVAKPVNRKFEEFFLIRYMNTFYLAIFTALFSRITVTFICPG